MKCEFVVGQKVVCVKHSTYKFKNGLPPFRVGELLTISDIFIYRDESGREYTALRFYERDKRQAGNYIGFRPVVTRKTDISIFTAMMNTSKEKVPS